MFIEQETVVYNSSTEKPVNPVHQQWLALKGIVRGNYRISFLIIGTKGNFIFDLRIIVTGELPVRDNPTLFERNRTALSREKTQGSTR
jgi:hypothetical protein